MTVNLTAAIALLSKMDLTDDTTEAKLAESIQRRRWSQKYQSELLASALMELAKGAR